MPTFRPPTIKGTPSTLPETTGVQYRLFRYFGAEDQGLNVFKLTSGRYTQDQPYNYDEIAIWYLGGHIYEVSDEEAASLSAAGYDVGTGGGGVPTDNTVGDLAGNTVGDLAGNTIGDFTP